ncbi:MAG: hypothetical protein NTV43_09840 [Methylococcales bacterium]|nr:hypothetical protein [Methylococcales bacterium]
MADANKVPENSVLAVWGMKPLPGVVANGVKILRLEDGFLRSVGLGTDLSQPMSLVVDGQGIYYDATGPSDLEQILAETQFSPEQLKRAQLLQQRIVAGGLTKYNVGLPGWRRPAGVDKVILVPGQVESDASLRYGAPAIRTNIGLLQAVRLANPNAYLVYKPHPDVLARLRAKGAGEEDALAWCDEQLGDVSMGDLLKDVDEVHVLTSLAGFEALMREKPVTCYGQPFYAGWGLTTDIVTNPRRYRRLSLAELVAGSLIEYPFYFSRTSANRITPEQALAELLEKRAKSSGIDPWWRELFRMVLRRVVGVR